MEIESIGLIGKKWFQRSFGNTYHTTQIVLNGELIHYTDKTYGYGDQWEQTGKDWLYENKFLPDLETYKWGGSEHLRMYCERKGISYFRSVSDVQREKDL